MTYLVRSGDLAVGNSFIKKLLQQVLEMERDFESGAATLSIQVPHLLRDWLVNHSGKSDKDLATVVRGMPH